jgi:hypothetical protein
LERPNNRGKSSWQQRHQVNYLKKENAEFYAETRSSRRESNPPTSAFSAPLREKKAGWETKSFEDCIVSVKYTRKIQRKDFLDDGQFPIVSQEAEFTTGYGDDETDVFKVSTPVVIFGDHTQILKYVDFDFVLGADGVKILSSSYLSLTLARKKT